MDASSKDEFDEFALAAWPKLVRTGYLLTGDHHLAEDLAQATLIRTYTAWRRVNVNGAWAYARMVLINLNIDRLRRRRLREVGDAVLQGVEERPAPGPEDREEIVLLLRTLSAKERHVVVLRHYFDLSEADVAQELGIAAGTVKSTLARALAKLRVSADDLDALRTIDRQA